MIRLRVKELAKARGLSMGKLSRLSDVSFTTIKRIFDDPYYSVTTHTLDKLANALGVTPADLIEFIPDREASSSLTDQAPEE
jgi:DNA-binding Xre family transcriptional regulator